MLALTAYLGQEIVLAPVRETGLMPVKETRALGLPMDFIIEPWVWNVVFVSEYSTRVVGTCT